MTKRMVHKLTLMTANVALHSLWLTSPARAETPAFVGMWSKTSVHCSTEQKRPGAPMLITQQGFDQYKLHCKFAALEPVAAPPPGSVAWKVTADCEWNGLATKMDMSFTVAGTNEAATLTLQDKGGTHTLRKCVVPQSKPATP